MTCGSPAAGATFARESRARASEPSYDRIPIGEVVRLDVGDRAWVDLRLDRHPFRLVLGEQAWLSDELGRRHPLAPGRQRIGRDRGCEVSVGREFGGVSRTHAVLELRESGTMLLSDLSTNGTFVICGWTEVTPGALRRLRDRRD